MAMSNAYIYYRIRPALKARFAEFEPVLRRLMLQAKHTMGFSYVDTINFLHRLWKDDEKTGEVLGERAFAAALKTERARLAKLKEVSK